MQRCALNGGGNMVRLIKIVFVVAVVALGALYFFGYDWLADLPLGGPK